ncbi:MAG: DUF3784 domain-containing protein [Clostridia bacterium]|nr:DUF3784 domain-containing protein [Clostridia bacterium]
MNASAIAGAVLCAIVVLGCGVLGIRQLLEKGKLINNAWLYASPEERKRMNKKPYYRQSSVCFLMIAGYGVFMLLYALTDRMFYSTFAYICMGAVLIYAVLSTFLIHKREKCGGNT